MSEQAKPAPATAMGRASTVGETAKETLQKKNEEMKAKLTQKSTELGKTNKTVSGPTKKAESAKEAEKHKEPEKPTGLALVSKIGMKKLSTATAAAADKTSGV